MKKEGIYISYSKVNQAYFVMFYDSILRIFNTKEEAKYYLKEISEQYFKLNFKQGETK